MIALEPGIKILFDYLRDVIYEPAKAVLDINALPEDFREFGAGFLYFTECVNETKSLAQALAKGDLTGQTPSRGNVIAAPLKSLQATLKHLTWQAQQIAQGDYKQRVDFMGEFSDAFNTMVGQLAERQQNLEEKIAQIQNKTSALEQSNLLFTTLVHYVPQQIIVTDINTGEILLMNDIAANEVGNEPDYIENLMRIIAEHKKSPGGADVPELDIDIIYKQGEKERYFTVKAYMIEWGSSNAEIFVINDVSVAKSRIKTLETHAYQDGMTQLYNRMYGMITLESWLNEKKRFVLVFADLDSLKYVNDEFGHTEGDMYIKNAGKHLKSFSESAIVCRLGGDEFMLLAPDMDYSAAHAAMSRIYSDFHNDEYLADKNYSYSISFGVAAVDETNALAASDILSVADERMYENKRMRKQERKAAGGPGHV